MSSKYASLVFLVLTIVMATATTTVAREVHPGLRKHKLRNKFKGAGKAMQFIHRLKKLVQATGAKMPAPVDQEAKIILQHALRKVNERRGSNGLPLLDLKKTHIHTYTKQAVAGTRHAFCVEATPLGAPKMDKISFDVDWYVPVDMSEDAKIVKIFPSSAYTVDLRQNSEKSKEDAYRCPILASEEEPTNEDSEMDPKALLEMETRARLMARVIPRKFEKAYDFREHTKPHCKSVLEHNYNQGACGSCYAYAAIGAAAARMCHAGHELWSKSLSVSDVLTCGTVMAGNSCTQFSSGPTLNYANGCDGGSADLVNMYAVDHGLVEGPCHADAVSGTGDPVSHMEPSQVCKLFNEGPPATIKCGSSYMDFDANEKAIVSKKFCTCAKDDQSGYENVQIIIEESDRECLLRKKITGKATFQCLHTDKDDGKISIALPSTDEVGAEFLVGSIKGGSIVTEEDVRTAKTCQCPHKHRVVDPPDSIVPIEKGASSTKTETCIRDKKGHVKPKLVPSFASGSCKAHRVFEKASSLSKSNEQILKLAILDGGPIAVGFKTHEDFSSYNGGVYESDESNPTGGHAIILFGWGEEKGKQFWWAKNSYGADWPRKGENGVFKFARGRDNSKIETGGANWLYVRSPTLGSGRTSEPRDGSQLPFCAKPAMEVAMLQEERNLKESCLRVVETGGAEEPFCTVKNICPDATVTYGLSTRSTFKECGMYLPRGSKLRPGKERKHEGFTSCCVDYESRDPGTARGIPVDEASSDDVQPEPKKSPPQEGPPPRPVKKIDPSSHSHLEKKNSLEREPQLYENVLAMGKGATKRKKGMISKIDDSSGIRVYTVHFPWGENREVTRDEIEFM
jgi:hypothetical protein